MRVGIYCRLSEEDRDKSNPEADSESIQNQKSLLLRHAVGQGWDIVDIYCDEDYAGSDRDRPDFNRLLRDCEHGRLDIVLCKTQSRFSRELEIIERYIHGLFLEWNVRFIGLVDNADTAVKGNKKSRQIAGLINEWYLEDLSDNIRAVLDDKRAKGRFIGAFAPYGYSKSAEDHNRLIIDEPAAAIVRRVFAWYAQGWGQSKIAAALNDEGTPCPTLYKQQQGLRATCPTASDTPPRWTSGTVARMLRNPVYAGDMAQGKQSKASYKSKRRHSIPRQQWVQVPGTHEPIVDRAPWEAAQALLARRPKPAAGGDVDPLAGRVFCALCGEPLHRYSVRGRQYLRCRQPELCEGTALPAAHLEQQVLEELNALAAELADGTQLQDTLDSATPNKRRPAALQAQRRQAAEAVARLEQASYTLFLDRSGGAVGEETFRMLQDKLTAQLAIARQRLQGIDAALQQTQQIPTPDGEVLHRYCPFPRLTPELTALFLNRVEVGWRQPGGATPITIQWNV